MKRKKLSIDALEIGKLTDNQQMNIRGGAEASGSNILDGCPVTTPPSTTSTSMTCPVTTRKPLKPTDLC